MGKYFNKLFIFRFSFSTSLGFTLIEVLVVITLMAVLTLSGVAVFFSYTRSQALQNGVLGVITVLDKAKSNAISQVKPEECKTDTLDGYRFSYTPGENHYSLDVRCSGVYYNLEKKDLPPQVFFATELEEDVFFEASSGVISKTAHIILSSNNKVKIISIDTVGNISVD